MASLYGVPDGSSLADWPIAYEDLEPYYDRAEWEIGVAGVAVNAGWRLACPISAPWHSIAAHGTAIVLTTGYYKRKFAPRATVATT